jgi:hypothetical protein
MLRSHGYRPSQGDREAKLDERTTIMLEHWWRMGTSGLACRGRRRTCSPERLAHLSERRKQSLEARSTSSGFMRMNRARHRPQSKLFTLDSA